MQLLLWAVRLTALITSGLLQSLVDIVKHGLIDENQKVKTITALTIAALAEAAAPYGIESFDDVLEPLWKGIRLLRGKVRIIELATTHCI